VACKKDPPLENRLAVGRGFDPEKPSEKIMILFNG